MSRAVVCAALLAVCLAPAAAATLPQPGRLVPGHSLAGIRVGEPAAAVRAALGRSYGVCQGCTLTTWYFTYRPFEQHGRVHTVQTWWRPAGGHTARGLRLGAVQAQVTRAAGATIPLTCSGYDALVSDAGRTRTVYYIVAGKLWGFGLLPARENPCR
jgi:hypothetical protein